MKVTLDKVRTWPGTGIVLGLVALVVLGVAYWSNVLDRERYFQSRNFRFVAELANQTSNLIENRARIFRDTVGDSRHASPDTAVDSDLGLAEIVSPAGSAAPPTAQELRLCRWEVRGEGPNLLFRWLPPSGGGPALSIKLPASAALRNTFRPKLRMGVFDTLVLATPAGQVVYALGRRASEMQATSLTAILPNLAGKQPDVARFADTISEHRIDIAGVSYRMFAQPCCRSDALDAGSGNSARSGFVVIGLADAEVMRVESWAISPVLVLFGVFAVLAALVGWPFLKCALMGGQQRITRRDVISLGTSALFGLALSTILLLSIAAYARLSADVSAELAILANSIHGRFEEEVRHAANQTRAMTDALRGMPCVSPAAVNDAIQGRLKGPASSTKHRKPADPCWAITKRWAKRRDLPALTTATTSIAASPCSTSTVSSASRRPGLPQTAARCWWWSEITSNRSSTVVGSGA